MAAQRASAELPAATALVAMLAIDVLVRSARGIDYACHAGGALFGLAPGGSLGGAPTQTDSRA